jgi:hypothetical protein
MTSVGVGVADTQSGLPELESAVGSNIAKLKPNSVPYTTDLPPTSPAIN